MTFETPKEPKPEKEKQQKSKGRRICAWCGKDMGELEEEGGFDSHGICPDCEKKYFPEEK